MVEETEKMNKLERETEQNEQNSRSTTFENSSKNDEQAQQNDSRQLARKSTLSLTNNILITLFGLTSLIVVKRYMGYEAVGMIAFSLAFCQMFSIAGDLGFGKAHLKRVSEGLDLGTCNGTFLTIKFFLTIIMGMSILSWLFIQKHLFQYEFESKELELVLYIIIAQYMLLNMGMTFKTLFSAKLEIAKGHIPHTTGRLFVMLMKVTVAVVGSGVVYLAGAELAGTVLMVVLYLILFRSYPLNKPNKEFIKRYARFAFPMMFIGFVGSLAYNMDKVLLGYLVGTTEVGIYTIPQRITVSLLLISTTITTILFVVFSELYQKKQFHEIQNLSNKAEKYISTAILPIIVFFFIFAKPALKLVFGDDAGASAPILQVMLVTLYIEATLNPYNVQIAATGHLRIAMLIALLALGLNVVLDMVLIPDELGGITLFGLGAKGAAYATFVTLTARSICAKFFAFRITRTKPNKNVLLHLISASVTGVVAYFLYQALYFHWLLLFIYAPLVLGMFLVLMRLAGEFTKDDIRFYLDAVHVGKMKQYVLGELKEGR